ncbi:MAG: hypothetical protein LLF94_01065 [Chlamydiales bacterium]|nr:hypothetical protein [Chlamydiales bacterium]
MASIGSGDSVQFFPRRESGFQESASVTFLPVDLALKMAPPNKPLPQMGQSLDNLPSVHSINEPLVSRQSDIKFKPESPTVRASAKLNSFAAIVKDVLASGIFKWSPIQNAKLRKNMLEQCAVAKREFLPNSDLTPQEIQSVNKQVDVIIKVNSARKSTIEAVHPDRTQANWTVRRINTISLGGVDFEVQMGRNYKAMIVYKAATEAIGKGSYGEVSPVGRDVKKGLGVLVKKSDVEVMNELKNEIDMTQELHKKAGGFQHGIQRSPYSLRSAEGGAKATVFVHRYETDLFHFKNEDLAKYGFTGKYPEAQLVEGMFIGLEAMHRNGMAHRDVKPENSGLQRDDKGKYESCLADFGAAVRKSSDNKSVFGTPIYMSVFDYQYQQRELTPERRLDLRQKQDVFAVGKSAIEILTNKVNDRALYVAFLPYIYDRNRNYKDINTSNPANDPIIKDALAQVENKFGKPVASMLARTIHSDPDQRPTIQEAAFVMNALAGGSIKEAPVRKTDPFELTGDFIGRPHVQKFIQQLIKDNPNQLSSARIIENIKTLSLYEQENDEIEPALNALKDLGLTRTHLLHNPDLLQELNVHFRYKVDSQHFVSVSDIRRIILRYFTE